MTGIQLENLKSISSRRPPKNLRERHILFGVVDFYIQTGKPVSSKSLQENGFESISSATIRNYFAKLEREGYLTQQHSSGGRTPTEKAYREYVKHHLSQKQEKDKLPPFPVEPIDLREERKVSLHLQQVAQKLSAMSQTAVFLSAPRFDHDYVQEIKLLPIDSSRILCAIMTDFGLVHTHTLHIKDNFFQKDILPLQDYFNWRLQIQNHFQEPEELNDEEKLIAKSLYNELMVRYIVNYSNFTCEDIYTTGFSQLLLYPEFNNAFNLASGLSLFENPSQIRSLLKRTCKQDKISCWIGEDLKSLSSSSTSCSVIAIPYKIKNKAVGAIALLGPKRLPYKQLFSLIKSASHSLSQTLTQTSSKFQITLRSTEEAHLPSFEAEEALLTDKNLENEQILLTNKKEVY